MKNHNLSRCLCLGLILVLFLLVFTGCMTAYTTPQLLGATDTQVLSTMVYQYAMSLRDWVQASAVAMVMIVVTMLVSGVFNRLSRKINPLAT